MINSTLFTAERDLVRRIAGAVAMNEVREAIDEYWSHPSHRSWLRRAAGLRISTLRLRRVAYEYLPFARSNLARRR